MIESKNNMQNYPCIKHVQDNNSNTVSLILINSYKFDLYIGNLSTSLIVAN